VGSKMIEEPANSEKLALIRRFLKASGKQHEIDSGSFLDRFALPEGPLTRSIPDRNATFREAFEIPRAALQNAYEKRRHVWQEQYESHLNWEFIETELSAIVAFLESEFGQHYLEGEWRMNAYTSTNTEALLEEIISEAKTEVEQPART
jgi:hypothetical protein